jgi:hypothetical protein
VRSVKAGTTQLSEESPSSAMRGKPLRFLGNTLLVLSVLGWISVTIALKTAQMDLGEALLTVGVGWTAIFLIAFIGVKCLKRGKQLGAESAQALLAEDKRPPVVYLRSFQDDSVAAEGTLSGGPVGALVGGAAGALMLAGLDLAGGIMTEEEQLAEALKDVGPFVAVGKPGEKLPQVGASRMYLQDSEWRDKVRGLMSSASLVVLRAGKTDGLWWEVQTAPTVTGPEKIIFLLPYEREQYDPFRSKAETYLNCRLPDYPAGKRNVGVGSVRGILYFEPDWKPHFLELAGFDRSEKPLVRAFKTTLEPVFKQLGVKVKIAKPSPLKVLLLVVLSPIVAIIALFLALFLVGLIIRLVSGE